MPMRLEWDLTRGARRSGRRDARLFSVRHRFARKSCPHQRRDFQCRLRWCRSGAVLWFRYGIRKSASRNWFARSNARIRRGNLLETCRRWISRLSWKPPLNKPKHTLERSKDYSQRMCSLHGWSCLMEQWPYHIHRKLYSQKWEHWAEIHCRKLYLRADSYFDNCAR